MKVKYGHLIVILCAFVSIASACHKTEATEDLEPQPDPMEVMVNRVRHTDRLYTTEYQVRKVVTYDDVVKLKGSVFNRQFDVRMPLGDRKVLIPMQAVIKGYIDFSGFGPDNVTVNDEDHTIRIVLPDPKVEMTSTKIDHRGVKEFTNRGRSRFSEAEMSDFEKQGRAAIMSSIPQLGIIETTRQHAYNTLLPIVMQMGYKPEQITIDFRTDLKDDDLLNIIHVMKD